MRSGSTSRKRASVSTAPATDRAQPPRAAGDFLNRLRIGGITPFSTVDWPGQLAVVLFLQGCPWRCAYCHNNDLQTACGDTRHDWPEVETLLAQRRGLIDGVVFSGGEPTAQLEITAAVRRVKELGFAIGLHTAGVYPRRLAETLPWLDWIALDVKALPEDYDQLTGVPGSRERVDEALELLLNSGKPFECRTTVDWSLLPPAALARLGERLAGLGVQDFAVQVARSVGTHYQPGTGDGDSREVLAHLATLFPRFALRPG